MFKEILLILTNFSYIFQMYLWDDIITTSTLTLLLFVSHCHCLSLLNIKTLIQLLFSTVVKLKSCFF